jgi:hypothetical protein
MAKAEFRVDHGLGEVVISDPPLNLFGMEAARRPTRAARGRSW